MLDTFHGAISSRFALSRDRHLNVMGQIAGSRVNGPGSRYVIWTQGCQKGCRGCFNPESWPDEADLEPSERVGASRGPRKIMPKELSDAIFDSRPDGLTISGGDPLEQPFALRDFLRLLHEPVQVHGRGFAGGFAPPPELNILPDGILLFTGFTRTEAFSVRGPLGAAIRECWSLCDVVVDGRYIEELRHADGLSGSSNQQFHFSNAMGRGEIRIARDEVDVDQAAEVFQTRERFAVSVTGFPDFSGSHHELRRLGLTVLK